MLAHVLSDLGMQAFRSKDAWSLMWGDTWEAVANVSLKRYQKVNHFPGMSNICRKDLLGKNMSRLSRHFPDEYVDRCCIMFPLLRQIGAVRVES